MEMEVAKIGKVVRGQDRKLHHRKITMLTTSGAQSRPVIACFHNYHLYINYIQ
jgi:hypothetical protein